MPPQAPEGPFTGNTYHVWYHQRLLGASGHAGTFRSIAYSPDGEMLAAALPEGTLKVWDANSGAEAFSFSGPTFVGSYFTPDSSRLVGISEDGYFRVFALELDELVALARLRLTRGWRPEECRQYLHTQECPVVGG